MTTTMTVEGAVPRAAGSDVESPFGRTTTERPRNFSRSTSFQTERPNP